MSNRKLEIMERMKELQSEFSTLNTEKKDIDEVERRAASHAKFADYKFKVGMYGARLYDEDQIQEVNDRDREEAAMGKSGIIYTNSETKDGYCALMMKDKAEYSRFKLLIVRLNAASCINEGKDKERNIKILLGEPVEEEVKQ